MCRLKRMTPVSGCSHGVQWVSFQQPLGFPGCLQGLRSNPIHTGLGWRLTVCPAHLFTHPKSRLMFCTSFIEGIRLFSDLIANLVVYSSPLFRMYCLWMLASCRNNGSGGSRPSCRGIHRKRVRVPSRLSGEPLFVSRRHPGKRLPVRNVDLEDGLPRDAWPLSHLLHLLSLHFVFCTQEENREYF